MRLASIAHSPAATRSNWALIGLLMEDFRQKAQSSATTNGGDRQIWDQEPDIRMSRHESGIQGS